MAKKEWLVVVWNDGSGQFSIERLAATKEEIKSYLLSLIEEDKELSQEICHECTNSVNELGRYEEPIQKILWRFMRMLLLIHTILNMRHVHLMKLEM